MDTKQLIDKLPDFYHNYSGNISTMDRFFQIFTDGIKNVCEYLEGIKRNSIISTVETYRRIPYYSIDIKGISYSLASLLANPMTEKALGLSNSTLQDRINFWNSSASVDQKIAVLDESWMYLDIDLTLVPKFLHDDTLTDSIYVTGMNGKIIDLKAETIDGSSLFSGVDFIISDSNRFYLLNDVLNSNGIADVVILKDIMIDYDAAYYKLGLFLDTPYAEIISKPEYRKINQVFLQAVMKGSSIKNIKDAISNAFGWNEASVYDAHSQLTQAQKTYWDTGAYGPYDFVINMPTEYFQDSDKVSMMDHYLSLIKPSYTRYYIQWAVSILDQISINDPYPTILLTHPAYNDNISMTDTPVATLHALEEKGELLAYQTLLGFDSNFVSSFDGAYKADTALPANAGDDPSPGILEQDQFTDICDMTLVTFPEIPILVSITKNGTIASIKFKNNATGIAYYSIMRNGVEVGHYIPSTFGTGATLEFQNSPGPGTFTYSVRSAWLPFPTQPQTVKYSLETPKVTLIM